MTPPPPHPSCPHLPFKSHILKCIELNVSKYQQTIPPLLSVHPLSPTPEISDYYYSLESSQTWIKPLTSFHISKMVPLRPKQTKEAKNGPTPAETIQRSKKKRHKTRAETNKYSLRVKRDYE